MTSPTQSAERPGERALALLLSIRPQHAHRIFEGSKHFELRKALPISTFQRVYLYETGGTGIVGWFDTGELIRKPIDDLWATVGNAATTREAFYNYFAHVKEGFAIGVRNAHRFATPVSATRLNGDRLRLLPPQSFIVLEPGQPLYMLLESERQATLRKDLPTLDLKKIKSSQRSRYQKLVLKHISPHYEDIDETFAAAILRVNDLGFDPTGFFTTKKEVLGIYKGRACVGFTTLTYKSGGCVKTGPTIILRPYRGSGYGQATRRAIEERARRDGVRKIYCTCPDSSAETIKYLLGSEMRVEAHLERHYATTHNELVFGKLLVSDENSVPYVIAPQSIACKVADPGSFRRSVLVRDIRAMFGRTWSPVSESFVRALIRQAVEEKATQHHEKPKRLVCLGTGDSCRAAIVLLPKRGGAVKGLLLNGTTHRPSLQQLLNDALTCTTRLNGRKLYFLHPVVDADAVAFLKSSGFRAEGLLRAPYVPGQDVIIMSRFV